MRVHVHSIIRNEEKMLPYFLRHYEAFCEKIFLRIQPSTDKTLEIAKAHPKVTIIKYKTEFGGGSNSYNIMDMQEVRNNDWKKYSTSENCDWVIIADCDEFLYHPNILKILQNYKNRGITFPKIDGYQMFSDDQPTTSGQIYYEIKTGCLFKEYSKRAIMHPSISPNYSPGNHQCFPKGNVVESNFADIKLLHYSKILFKKEEYIKYWKDKLKRNSGSYTEKNKFNETPYLKLQYDDYVLDSLYHIYITTLKNFMKFAKTGKVDDKQGYYEVI